MFESDRRFDVIVRLPDTRWHSDPESLKRLPIALPRGSAAGEGRTTYIPLSEVVSLDYAPGPNQISHARTESAAWW